MQVMRISDVLIISMLMLESASVRNMRAATPGVLSMPVPTRDTLARPPEWVTLSASTCVTAGSTKPQRVRQLALATVNVRSVCSSLDTFCTMTSTEMPATLSGSKTARRDARLVRHALDGHLGHSPARAPRCERDSCLPLGPRKTIMVPRSPVEAGPDMDGHAVQRSDLHRPRCITRAPTAAISRISSYAMCGSMRALGSTRGSAVMMPSTSVQISQTSAPRTAAQRHGGGVRAAPAEAW